MLIPRDKLKHILVCTIIAMSVMALLYVMHSSLLIAITSSILCAIFAGIGKEYGDKVNPYNKWDWRDFTADSTGAVLGSLVGSSLWLI